jgi:lysozyme
MARQIGDSGLELIKQFEGCRLTAYQDVVGIWTIGYGHIAGVSEGMQITEEEADELLREDLASAEEAVDAETQDVATTDNQFGAMVSLCFNIGAGNFRSSSMLRDHRAGNLPAAADDFLKWDKARVNGMLEVVQGLLNRRKAERELYLTP